MKKVEKELYLTPEIEACVDIQSLQMLCQSFDTNVENPNESDPYPWES